MKFIVVDHPGSIIRGSKGKEILKKIWALPTSLKKKEEKKLHFSQQKIY